MEQSESSPQPNLYMHAAKFGAMTGALIFLFVIVFYVIDYSILATMKFLGLILLVSIGMIIYAGTNYRKEIGGYISYGKAWIHGFILCAASGVVGLILGLLLYHVIDPELPQKMTEAIMSNTEEMMRNFGAPEESIDQTLNKMRTDMAGQFSPAMQAYQTLKNLIGAGVIVLLTSLIVRKSEPVEM